MSDLLAARSQMAMSLAFHIIFAAVGIGMPLLMVIAEGLWLRTREEVYLTLAQRWAKGAAILFAVGAVSGTAALAGLYALRRRNHRDAVLA
jgi:cytochrome d ubiquinol oxidase subunit I